MKQMLEKFLMVALFIASSSFAYALDDAEDGKLYYWTKAYGELDNIQDPQNSSNRVYKLKGYAQYGRYAGMGNDIGKGDVFSFDLRTNHNYSLSLKLTKEGSSIVKYILARPQNYISDDMHAISSCPYFFYKPLPISTKDGTFHRVTINLNTIFDELHIDKDGYKIAGVYFFNMDLNEALEIDNLELSNSTGADTVPPKIVLNGSNSVNITVGDTFTDPGATAIDNMDGNITNKIVVQGSVDTTKAGNYILIYVATDSAGNSSSVARGVIAEEPKTPSINILPNARAYLIQEDRFNLRTIDTAIADSNGIANLNVPESYYTDGRFSHYHIFYERISQDPANPEKIHVTLKQNRYFGDEEIYEEGGIRSYTYWDTPAGKRRIIKGKTFPNTTVLLVPSINGVIEVRHTITTTTSDSNGNFELFVPSNLQHQYITIQANGIDGGIYWKSLIVDYNSNRSYDVDELIFGYNF